eukprot:TRINITY_DN1850_c0_g1_i1.p1 TRINITY_DN1850_c0_g1~~TRINITY_DN1850_c0_g1_i1.p1  ORF type:complete len:144 (+),score=21.57 TRINITY_DN1850_c0_g1_i1:180-611(+)
MNISQVDISSSVRRGEVSVEAVVHELLVFQTKNTSDCLALGNLKVRNKMDSSCPTAVLDERCAIRSTLPPGSSHVATIAVVLSLVASAIGELVAVFGRAVGREIQCDEARSHAGEGGKAHNSQQENQERVFVHVVRLTSKERV